MQPIVFIGDWTCLLQHATTKANSIPEGQNNAGLGSQTAPRKRKRSGASDAQTRSMWQDANQRHAQIAQFLEEACRNFAKRREDDLSLKQRGQALPAHCEIHDADISIFHDQSGHTCSSDTDVPVSENPQWNLQALSQLRKVVHPKFSFAEQASACNLFDTVISNDKPTARTAWAHETRVSIPARSSFLLADMAKFEMLTEGPARTGFECLVIDPPWENKSVSRSKKYATLYAKRLLQLQPTSFLNKSGGLVALWMTNREKLHQFVEAELIPKWGLKVVAKWFWLKLTPAGLLKTPLSSSHRRPYEPVLLLASSNWTPCQDLPNQLAIFSVAREHSRKPHLAPLVRQFLDNSAACCELFARELHEGWSSAGDEVLLFQRF